MGIRRILGVGRDKEPGENERTGSEAGLRPAEDRQVEIRRDPGRRPLFRRRNRLLRFGRL